MMINLKKIASILSILALTIGVATAKEYKFKFQDPELPLEERLDDLLGQMTLDEKISILKDLSPDIERLEVAGVTHGNEALHGVVRPGKFTVFPRPLGLAATFNPEAIQVMADCISDESRARFNENGHKNIGGKFSGGRFNGLLTFWSPTVNMARDPRWGRTGETYGEDPFLTARMGVAFTKGLQGDGKYFKAIATPKHFVANNQENGRFAYNATVPMRSLFEYYLQGFKACIVEGGAFSIMAAYNSVNGVPCSVNSFLLKDVLRDQWGFKGYVVGDLRSPRYVLDYHYYTSSGEQTAAMCIKNGLELDSGYALFKWLKNGVKQGFCSEKDVEEAARKVLRGRFKLGLFDPEEMVPYNKINPNIVGCEKHQKLALELAEQSIVLLKNDKNSLPFGKDVKKIGLLGSNIDTYKHKQYSCEDGSFNPPITPAIAMREVCKDKGVELVQLKWEDVAISTTPAIIKKEFFFGPDGKSAGFEGVYYKNSKFQGEPFDSRIDRTIDFNRTDKAPDGLIINQPMSAKWRGKLLAPVEGSYEVRVEFNGSLKLTINGKEPFAALTKDNGRDQMRKFYLDLKKGEKVDVQIDYADTKGNSKLALSWIVPASQIRKERLSALSDCDKVVMVMGLGNHKAGEGVDKLTLKLEPDQEKLIKEVSAINPNITLVLMNSTVLDLSWEEENIPSIVEAWYPGEKTGYALTNILWGKTNPSGRLPITFCKSVYDLPSFASYDITEGRTYIYSKAEPLYEFGYGLSYTSFKYEGLKLNRSNFAVNDVIDVRFKLSNNGEMDGDEVSQIYIKPLKVNTSKDYILPNKQLKGIKRTRVEKGAEKEVIIEVPVSSLTYFDEATMEEKVFKGTFELQVGASSKDIRLKQNFSVK